MNCYWLTLQSNMETEHILLSNNDSINWGKDEFWELYKKTEREFGKPVIKEYTLYVKDDLYMEVSANDIKVWKKTGLYQNKSDRTLRCDYHKAKVPIHMFPSTLKLHDIVSVKLHVFRVKPNGYMNFEIKNDEYLKIYKI